MSYFKNRGFWFWGFIILVLINLSVLISMAYVMNKIHTQEDYQGFHKRFIKNHHRGHNKQTKNLIRSLNLSDEQKEELQALRRKHFTEMRQLKKHLQIAQHKLFSEASKEHPDSILVMQYRQDLTQIQDQITDLSLDFYRNMRKVLNKEQQKKMKEFYENRFQKINKSINNQKQKSDEE